MSHTFYEAILLGSEGSARPVLQWLLLENLGTIFEVSSMTMARYIRAYEKYGESFWSPYPTEVEDARPET